MIKGRANIQDQPLAGFKQQGFTLLEAIVALVLIGSLGLALMSWLNSSISQLSHVRNATDRTNATRNALAFMANVNPTERPAGEFTLPDFRLSWKASPITEPTDGANYPYDIGLWQFTLYATHVEIFREDTGYWFNFDLKQIGYKRVRSNNFKG